MASAEEFTFDCLKLSETLGRENTFPMVVFKIMNDLPNKDPSVVISNDKLLSFLDAIYRGYRRDVAYHNDLHGADVAQYMYLFIKHGNLANLAQLNYLDLVSAISAAACHDFDHDGFNNAYHVNFMTDRALRYHDKAVQENWHASESMKLILEESNNFIECFNEEEIKVLRKRFVGMILATDMANHASHVNVMQYKVKSKNIKKESNNGNLIIDTSSEKEKFTS